MQADFWHARWANNQIGFHLDEINPYLMRHRRGCDCKRANGSWCRCAARP